MSKLINDSAQLKKEMILKQANEAYAILKKDKKAWKKEQEEVILNDK
jgi:tRNA A22 N-methylase